MTITDLQNFVYCEFDIPQRQWRSEYDTSSWNLIFLGETDFAVIVDTLIDRK